MEGGEELKDSRHLSSRMYMKVLQRLLLLSCFVLAGWMFYLMVDLPTSYRAQNWDLAWIGFDAAMLTTLSTTTWAIWRTRQLAIPASMVSATFLIIDSWFDVTTSQSGIDFKLAVATAVFVELPLALLLVGFSRRSMRQSLINAHKRAGIEIVSLSLRKTHLAIFDSEQ
jgi:hypothetical protein